MLNPLDMSAMVHVGGLDGGQGQVAGQGHHGGGHAYIHHGYLRVDTRVERGGVHDHGVLRHRFAGNGVQDAEGILLGC